MSYLQINSHYQIVKFITILACVMFFLGGIYLLHPWSSSLASATETPTEVTVSENSTPYIDPPTSSVDKITMSVDPTASGTYASALDTVTVKTNNPAGYHLYISTDDPKLYLNGNNSSEYYIGSTNGTYSNPQALRANSYGYAIPSDDKFDDTYSTPNPSTTSTWAALPTSNQLIQTVNHANTSGETLDIYYGAYLNNAVASGTYSGSVTYTAIPDEYSAPDQPQANAAINPTTGTVGIAVPVTIVTNLYTMADVGTVTVTIGGKTCANPTSSTSTGILTISCTVSTELAAGKHTVVVNVPSYGKTYTIANGYEALTSLRSGLYMQDITPEMCNNTKFFEETGATYDLIDRRDNNSYRVRKLKDGNCWMVQNLRLTYDSLAANNHTTLTPNDSNISSNFNFTTKQNSNTWCTNDNAACTDIINHRYTGNAEYGTYYNWYTATAGTGKWSTTEGNASSSICPGKGANNTWHIPSGEPLGNSEWYNLFNVYQGEYGWTIVGVNQGGNTSGNNTTNNLNSAIGPSFVYSGGIETNGPAGYNQGKAGTWFSATPNGETNVSLPYVDTSGIVGPGHSGWRKRHGYAVRCLLSSSS